MKNHWRLCFFFGVLGIALFGVEIALSLSLVTFHGTANGTVKRVEDGFSRKEIEYGYRVGDAVRTDTHITHFPETFFVPRFQPEEGIAVHYSTFLDGSSVPARAAWPDLLMSILWGLMAFSMAWESRRRLRQQELSAKT